ncbi:AAA family ATPase [Brevundimonas sp. BT-123]|uniref:AAA family ATPase n=1 Tax=Brevundimonas sp. BT-123 TaxID=2986928 RepID=UPI002235880F|nr:AAA family ATPase [Brevundimonas sp. BT-123]MCW0047201.1 AAA family ATPase [Brevundimonas sp. BT-123]
MSAVRSLADCKTDAEIDAWFNAEAEKTIARPALRAVDLSDDPEMDRYLDALDEPLDLEKPPRQSRFSAADLWDMDFPPVSWVVPDYIAGGLTLLVGAPKLGKSWLSLDVARAVAEGGFVLGDRHCVQGSALYAALEDNPRRLKDRLHRVCARKPTSALTIWTEMRMLDAGGLDDLRQWILAAANPRLIVIDVLNKVRSSQGKSEAPYAYDYRSVTPLKELADEFGIAIIVVHHTRKAEAGDKLEKVSGTNGLTGAADTTIILDRDGEGVTLSGRGRDIAEFETAMEFDKDTCRWRVLGDAKEVRVSDERKAILEALEGEGEPVGPNAIADVSGLKRDNVRFLLGRMVKAGEVQKVGRGKYLHPDLSPPHITHIAHIDEDEA